MGCTLHQHGHSHGGGGGGHGHGHGHSHGAAAKPSEAIVNGGFRSSRDDIEGAGNESSSEESCSSSQTHVKQNINVRAAYIHVIGDFLQSVGVFAAAIVIYFEVKRK
jgi:zinc transporter 2